MLYSSGWLAFSLAFIGLGIENRLYAAGISIAINYLAHVRHLGCHTSSAAVLGLYGIPGAPHNPNEWSSLLIAAALWEVSGRSPEDCELTFLCETVLAPCDMLSTRALSRGDLTPHSSQLDCRRAISNKITY
jgi:hypothetical protein